MAGRVVSVVNVCESSSWHVQCLRVERRGDDHVLVYTALTCKWAEGLQAKNSVHE